MAVGAGARNTTAASKARGKNKARERGAQQNPTEPRGAVTADVSPKGQTIRQPTDRFDEEPLTSVPEDLMEWKLPAQKAVYTWYQEAKVQFFVAGLIFANFIVSATNSQVLPNKEKQDEHPSWTSVFYAFDVFFAWIFTIELLINMWGSYWTPFWKSGWNIFDFVIVIISLLAIYMESLPGIAVLRLFRAFRVFRLFKRIPELKAIIEGVINSLPGVGNAFVVLGLIMGIWSIMGVEFFAGRLKHGKYHNNFGNFSRAMLSLFQIMTFDSWSSGIAWEIIIEWPQAAIYFVSYVFLAGIVMANVVVAILLNKFLESSEGGDDKNDDGMRQDSTRTTHRASDISSLQDVNRVELTTLANEKDTSLKDTFTNEKGSRDMIEMESMREQLKQQNQKLAEIQSLLTKLARKKEDGM